MLKTKNGDVIGSGDGPPLRILRRRELKTKVGYSAAHIDRLEKAGELRPIAEHNAKVYAEVTAATKDLAEQEIKSRKTAAEAETAQAEAAKARRQLDAERAAFVQEKSDSTARLSVRADELDRQADALDQATARARALQVSCDDLKFALTAFLPETPK